MGNPNLTPDERFTYRHYKTWPDSERWELIEGQAWAMSPAPKARHQRLVLRLARLLDKFLDGKTCRVFIAPFDVLLPEGDEPDDEIDSVVQPDIVVYCDRGKLTEAGGRGAPDLVVEVLSPSTSKKDQNDKFALYERPGVREYWVLEPADRWLMLYRLTPSGKYAEGELRERLREYGSIASGVLEGFVVDPEELFAELD